MNFKKLFLSFLTVIVLFPSCLCAALRSLFVAVMIDPSALGSLPGQVTPTIQPRYPSYRPQEPFKYHISLVNTSGKAKVDDRHLPAIRDALQLAAQQIAPIRPVKFNHLTADFSRATPSPLYIMLRVDRDTEIINLAYVIHRELTTATPPLKWSQAIYIAKQPSVPHISLGTIANADAPKKDTAQFGAIRNSLLRIPLPSTSMTINGFELVEIMNDGSYRVIERFTLSPVTAPTRPIPPPAALPVIIPAAIPAIVPTPAPVPGVTTRTAAAPALAPVPRAPSPAPVPMVPSPAPVRDRAPAARTARPKKTKKIMRKKTRRPAKRKAKKPRLLKKRKAPARRVARRTQQKKGRRTRGKARRKIKQTRKKGKRTRRKK